MGLNLSLHGAQPGPCMDLKLDPALNSTWALHGTQPGASPGRDLGQAGPGRDQAGTLRRLAGPGRDQDWDGPGIRQRVYDPKWIWIWIYPVWDDPSYPVRKGGDALGLHGVPRRPPGLFFDLCLLISDEKHKFGFWHRFA